MKKIFLILFLSISAIAGAQTLRVDAPNVVTRDETFRVIFTADGKITDFDWPAPSDFDVVWGPQRGSSMSTTIINGKRETTHTETYTYIVQPKKEGTFSIKGATCTIKKQECTSGDFTIEVVKAAAQPSQQQGGASGSSQNSQQIQGSATQISGEDVFMRLSLSKGSVTRGEPVYAELKFYTKVDIAGFENVKFPTFNGFWSKETYTPDNIEFVRENVGGAIYNVAVLRRYMLIPQQSGKITIDPAQIVVQVRVRANSFGGSSIFDDFFDSYQTIRKQVSTDAITVNVKDLPEGAPASFGGGVGNFTITARMASDSVAANEATSLKVTISGSGNISMVEVPKIEFPEDFEVYDVKSSDKIADNGTSGSRVFEYPIIPRSYGDFKIPPIKYSYYDNAKGKYVTIESQPVSLKVSASADVVQGGVMMPGTVRQSVRNISEDIRFIAIGDGDLRMADSFMVTSPLFYALVVLVMLILFVAVKVMNYTAARRADVAGSRNRKANKMAHARLKVAKSYIDQSLPGAYYEELHKALIGYISDKLTISVADLSKDNIVEALLMRGVSNKDAKAIIEIIDECEFARYAPDSSNEGMAKLYNDAVMSISNIENGIKRVKSSASKAVVTLLLIMLSMGVSAQQMSIKESWEAANSAYAENKFQVALDLYSSIEQRGIASADLYYNMGNTYYKLGDVAHTLLYYHKSLKLDPSHKDAAANLAMASGAMVDKIDSVPQFILAKWVDSVKYLLSSDAWAWITLALLAIVALLMFGFKFMHTLGLRRASFIVGCVFAVFALITYSFSLSERADAISMDYAVVMNPVSSVKSSPGDAGKSLFILHEGTKVEILDELGSWFKIEISDGRQGWMPMADIERI